jgi:hypothetical protein
VITSEDPYVLVDLPQSSNLNISALASIFNDATTSYKFLLFRTLLEKITSPQYRAEDWIPFDELSSGMLVQAWFPHSMFKLSFGKQDKIARLLDSIEASATAEVDKSIIEGRASTYVELRSLMRYVPFLLLRPFLVGDLNSSSPQTLVPRMTNAKYSSKNPPIYRFNSDDYAKCDSIQLHPHWVDYFQQHAAILKGWHSWKWLKYMQAQNPYTPSLAEKLFEPAERASLTEQRKYWQFVIDSGLVINCIYSGATIHPKAISIDHYLPWSFVCHNEIWNLVPTTQSINSSKSNRIPSRSLYFHALVGLQHGALVRVTNKDRIPKSIEKLVASYFVGLGLKSREDIQSHERFLNAYERIFFPLEEIAKNQGFSTEWNHKLI